MKGETPTGTVVLDVDGTLIDSNYHHALAWSRAFRHCDVTVPVWRIHRAIGMGGDKLVAAVAGDDVEREHGDDVRDRWEKEYDEIIDETRLLPGAKELLAALRERGVDVALASSSIPKHAQHAFDLLDADDLADTATTAEDAEESKPDPELVEEALSRLEGRRPAWSATRSTTSRPRAGPACRRTACSPVATDGPSSRRPAAGVYVDLTELLERLDEWLPTRSRR